MKKRVLLFTAFFLFITVLSGCKASQAPEEVVKSYVAAAKAQDFSTMQKLSTLDSAAGNLTTSVLLNNSDIKSLVKSVTDKTTVDIVSDAVIDGDDATVKVKIKGPDAEKFSENALSSCSSAVMAKISDGKASTSPNDYIKIISDAFKTEINKSNVAMKTTESNVKLTKQLDQWKIKDSNLTGEITGNVSDYIKKFSNSININLPS